MSRAVKKNNIKLGSLVSQSTLYKWACKKYQYFKNPSLCGCSILWWLWELGWPVSQQPDTSPTLELRYLHLLFSRIYIKRKGTYWLYWSLFHWCPCCGQCYTNGLVTVLWPSLSSLTIKKVCKKFWSLFHWWQCLPNIFCGQLTVWKFPPYRFWCWRRRELSVVGQLIPDSRDSRQRLTWWLAAITTPSSPLVRRWGRFAERLFDFSSFLVFPHIWLISAFSSHDLTVFTVSDVL